MINLCLFELILYFYSDFFIYYSPFMNYLISMENLFSYSPIQYFTVSHLLALGFAVMLWGLVYFLMTVRQTSAKYRVLSALSGVVMVSAFLILFFQWQSWENAFVFNELTWMFERQADKIFTNWYRYLNWLIDVPMLLIQILFVVTLWAAKRFKLWSQFVFSWAAMIILWYVGQFYESTDTTALLVWGALSTIFFLHILYLMNKILKDWSKDQSIAPGARKILKNIWILFMISWTLYIVAYLMPVISMSADGVVVRQLVFTVADISSKVIYGIMLMQAVIIRSKEEEGYVLS